MCTCVSFIYAIYVLILYMPILSCCFTCGCLVRYDLIKKYKQTNISYNALFCNRNVHMCAHFCYKILNCRIVVKCVMGFVKWVYWGYCSNKCRRHWLWKWLKGLFLSPTIELWIITICNTMRKKLHLIGANFDYDENKGPLCIWLFWMQISQYKSKVLFCIAS